MTLARRAFLKFRTGNLKWGHVFYRARGIYVTKLPRPMRHVRDQIRELPIRAVVEIPKAE